MLGMSAKTTEDTSKYLWRISNEVLKISPNLSKFYIHKLKAESQLERLDVQEKLCKSFTCHFCGAFWTPADCRVRCQSRPTLTKKLKRLLRRQRDAPWKLNQKQQYTVRRFKSSTNNIVYTCLSCNKKSVLKGSASVKIPDALLKKTSVLHTPKSVIKTSKKKKKALQKMTPSSLQTPDSSSNPRFSYASENRRHNFNKKGNSPNSTFETSISSSSKAKRRSLLKQALDEDLRKRSVPTSLSGFLLSL